MSITLTADELRLLTGYQQPGRQLEELRRQGYWRARRVQAGRCDDARLRRVPADAV